VRAYVGIDDRLDFVVLGRAKLPRQGNVIQSQVSIDSLTATAMAANYTLERMRPGNPS
jgi:hypothetical protein